MTITLTRNNPKANAVNGLLVIPAETGYCRADRLIPTLENAEFLIPAGTYPLDLTWSPRFKKLMPLISDVPEREGIRIHMGSKPEHSEGCVLVPNQLSLESIKNFINYCHKYYEDEQLQIAIRQTT